MIYRYTQQDIDEYFERNAINQTAIKALLKTGIQLFKMKVEELLGTREAESELYYEEKEHFLIGSAVDCKITMGQGVFEETYFVSEMKRKPSPMEMSIVKRVFDTIVLTESKADNLQDSVWSLDGYPEALYESCNFHEYDTRRRKENWQEDTRIASLLKKPLVTEYWNELIKSNGKQILSDDQALKVSDIYISFLTHPHTARLFEDGGRSADTVYQFPMYWEYEDEDCKGLIDMVYVDHAHRKIMPINIKTTGGFVLNFNKEVEKRRYDIGEAWYYYGLKKNLVKLATLIGKDLDTYHLSNHAFIVESTLLPGTPMIYPLTDGAMDMGRSGSYDRSGKQVLGWEHGMLKYKMWKDLNFSLRERFKETNGVVWIEEDFTYNEEF